MGDEHDTVAAPDSALAGLRARRKKAEAALYLDLRVPRYDPPLYVRYRPAKQREVNAANDSAAASKDPDRFVTANALVLTHACMGVFEVVDGKEVSIDEKDRGGDWPKFDAQLAQLLEIPEDSKPTAIVRCLYLTDGDVTSACAELTVWSGDVRRRTEEETEGN